MKRLNLQLETDYQMKSNKFENEASNTISLKPGWIPMGFKLPPFEIYKRLHVLIRSSTCCAIWNEWVSDEKKNYAFDEASVGLKERKTSNREEYEYKSKKTKCKEKMKGYWGNCDLICQRFSENFALPIRQRKRKAFSTLKDNLPWISL